ASARRPSAHRPPTRRIEKCQPTHPRASADAVERCSPAIRRSTRAHSRNGGCAHRVEPSCWAMVNAGQTLRLAAQQRWPIMPTDTATEAIPATHHHPTSKSTHTSRHLERAQVVWQRALELDALERQDLFAVALELLRTAHHHPTAMAHALTLGRNQLQSDADNLDVRGGVDILERTLAFLGVKPIVNDATRDRRALLGVIVSQAAGDGS